VRALVLAFVIGASAGAQTRLRPVVQADSAFAAGNVQLADSLYYIAIRMRPRDPEARSALGRFLGAQGRAKVAVVLLEEARMFGGDPAAIARLLAPQYTWLGDWRALLTLPSAPLTGAERRRVAWLSENPFGAPIEGGAAPIIGLPKGDTIARVAVRIAGKASVASIVGTDIGWVAGRSVAAGARRFEGDSTVIAFDSVSVGQARFENVPATVGATATTVTIGAAALARLVVQIDYKRNRIVLVRADAGAVESRYMLVRDQGMLRVLDRERWVSLGEFAATVAKAAKTLIIDVAAGEVRIRP
jgi:hypothetical protein